MTTAEDYTPPEAAVAAAQRHGVALGPDAPLFEIMRTMRAMRRLRPDPVPRELLEKLVEAATWAPSGSNSQTYAFVVVTDRAQIARLAPIWRAIAEWYAATQEPAEHMSADYFARLADAVREQAEHFEEIPALIVAGYDFSVARRNARKNAAKILAETRKLGARRAAALVRNGNRAMLLGEASSVYPGVQNLLLAARAYGLAATLTTWHLLLEGEFKDVLGIPSHVHTFAIVPVGWPRGHFGPVSRRPATIHWDRW
jgi:nitroreductase